jgi:hypothetical protein
MHRGSMNGAPLRITKRDLRLGGIDRGPSFGAFEVKNTTLA